MGSLVLPVAIGAAAVGGWFLLYTLILLATRPARPDPAPATQALPGRGRPAQRCRGGGRPRGRRGGAAGHPARPRPAAPRGLRLAGHLRGAERLRQPAAR